jgi:cytochrome P450
MPTHHHPPTPKGNPFLGNWQQYTRNPLEFLQDSMRTYGDVFRVRFAYLYSYMFMHPDVSHEILAKQAQAFEKDPITRRSLGRIIHQGLTVDEGESWQRQRRLMQPAFHVSRINSYVQMMVQYTEQMLASWREGEIFDVNQELIALTLRIVAQALFGTDVMEATSQVSKSMAFLEESFTKESSSLPVPYWLPTPHNLAVNRILQGLDILVWHIIAEHRSAGKDTGDLLSMLLLAQDEDGSQMSDQQLHDEVLTLLLAGHETTANALVWACYLLAQHPEVAEKLREEVDSVLGKRAPTLEDLPRLQYVDMVIKETLRFYPPAWILGRQAMQDVELGGYQIRRGTMIFVSPYIQHHDSRWFEQPEEFLPERFSEENEKKIRAHAYIPFGAGPRACIGSRFTLTEQKVVLTLLAQKCKLTLASDQKVEMEPLITIRPKGGMRMIVTKQ